MSGLGRKEFSAGDILLASEVQGYLQDQAVMVFADSTARGSAIPSPSEGMLTYNLDTGSLELYDGSSYIGVGSMSKRIEAFTASGTWTVPTGVTYAIAHILGGGGGVNSSGATAGGNSSVAFAGGTVTATGGGEQNNAELNGVIVSSVNAAANSGDGGIRTSTGTTVGQRMPQSTGGNGAFIVAGDSVTPAASITVTVGAGGSGAGSGGSGYVFIEYYE